MGDLAACLLADNRWEIRAHLDEVARARLRVTCRRLYEEDERFVPLDEWTYEFGLSFRRQLAEDRLFRWSAMTSGPQTRIIAGFKRRLLWSYPGRAGRGVSGSYYTMDITLCNNWRLKYSAAIVWSHNWEGISLIHHKLKMPALARRCLLELYFEVYIVKRIKYR